MWRSFTAAFAGFVVGTVLFLGGVVAIFVLLHGIPLGASPGPPTTSFYIMNLGAGLLAGLVAGSVTARIAHPPRRPAIMLLGVAMAAVLLWGFSKPGSQWPAWYPGAIALVALISVYVGGVMRAGPALR